MNWVKLRLACNSRKIFEAVKDRVKSDLDEMNGAVDHINYETHEELGVLKIFPNGHNLIGIGSVTITCNAHKIHVENDARHVDDFFINWAWNQDTASCDMYVNGEKMRLWEVSQKALYPIFFPEDSDIPAPVS